MCGIAGVVTWRADPGLDTRVQAMATALQHRGPDDAGIWVDAERGVALGHRRLSIIDLSPSGKQPMTCALGRRVIVYNGEIYNFNALRIELERIGRAPGWRGRSDTEVLLAAIEAWGLDAALERAVGMFAFALWDRAADTLTLARDRLGEKPLYYGVVNGRFYFASELNAIRASEGNALKVDRASLSAFMQFGCVPSPHSIYTGIHKLPPGHSITVRRLADPLEPRPFWRLVADDRIARLRAAAGCSDDVLLDGLHDRLSEAVAGQLVSDVPLGAFLSGGVDSSVVVALMQRHSARPVRTFTIGFRESGFDEAPYARAVARHLGTDHSEMYLAARDAAELIPTLPRFYDEPFADSSQIPTTLIARMTRQHVTVALSGDGGDELFAGYPRYRMTASLWQRLGRLPLAVRSAIATLIASPTPQAWDRVLTILPEGWRRDINGRRMHRLAELMGSTSVASMYVRLMSRWVPEDGLVLGDRPMAASPPAWASDADAVDAMRIWDIGQYLPDDLLVKVDRAAMSASLETRAPFLDHRVVELALSLPKRVLIRGNEGKWALRQILDQYVPRKLIDRPKAGFEVPLGVWLRGPLRPWAESLLDARTLAAQGFLDERKISEMWQQHLLGRFDRSQYLWNVLMFQAWLQSVQPPLAAPQTRSDNGHA